MAALAILFGGIVGFALGLTGGGGGVFAVPLLVYGLAIAPRMAVGISLASVGGTALFGMLPRWNRGEVEVRTGLMFAVAGMLGAPLGSYLSTFVPDSLLLTLFGGLMMIVAWRMWQKGRAVQLAQSGCGADPAADSATCRRNDRGELQLTSRCAVLLSFVGLLTGILSGMFGVGGGFVIVPALVLFSGMSMHHAVGTSLLAIFLISLSGVAAYVTSGKPLSLETTYLVLIGGFAGMWAGGQLSKRLAGATLQKVFAVTVVLVACFVIVKSSIG